METMQTQIRLLLAARAVRSFMIMMPIIVLYWQSHGLLIRDIFVLQVIFSIAIVVLEVPSGYFADKYGRKLSLVLGSIMGAVGFFFYWAIPSYLGFVLAELVLALSVSFISGAREALMYETLHEHGQEKLFSKYQGNLLAIGTVSEAIAALLAGVIASMTDVSTVLLIQWLVLLIAVPLSLALYEVHDGYKQPTPALLKIITGSLKENRRLRYLNIFYGSLAASTLTMVWFVQPYWEHLGVSVLYFGYIWAGLNLTVALGATVAHRLEKLVSFRSLFGLIAILPLLLYLSLSYNTNFWLALCIIPTFWLLRGVAGPIMADYVQRECKDGERATVISINALASRLIFSVFSPFLGWVADVWSFQEAFLVSGLVFGLLSIVSFLWLYGAMKIRSVA